jgi:hypothetical protein
LTSTKHRIQGHTDFLLGRGLPLLLRCPASGLFGDFSQVDRNSRASGSGFTVANVWLCGPFYRCRRSRARLPARTCPKLRAGPRHQDREMAGREWLAITLSDALGRQVLGEFRHRPSRSEQRLDFIEDVGEPALQQCAVGTPAQSRNDGPEGVRLCHFGSVSNP